MATRMGCDGTGKGQVGVVPCGEDGVGGATGVQTQAQQSMDVWC